MLGNIHARDLVFGKRAESVAFLDDTEPLRQIFYRGKHAGHERRSPGDYAQYTEHLPAENHISFPARHKL